MLSDCALLLAGTVAAIFSVLMIFQRSLYVSAICLLGVLLQAAVIFFLSGAPLLAFLQVMIYAGAIMVLVVVTIMAAPMPTKERWAPVFMPRPLAILGVLAPVVESFWIMIREKSAATAVIMPLAQLQLGSFLFKPYAIATEAVTLLLFLSALAVILESGATR